MAETADTSAWIALFLGLYILAAGVGELRSSGTWTRLLDSFEQTPAVAFLSGAFTTALGAAIYLASPWRPGDVMSMTISVIGGLAAVKGLVFIAAPDRMAGLGRKLMTRHSGSIAGISAVVGAGFVITAVSRLQSI